MAVDYKVVKHCNFCKKRFVVNKTDSRKRYCSHCQSKIDKSSE